MLVLLLTRKGFSSPMARYSHLLQLKWSPLLPVKFGQPNFKALCLEWILPHFDAGTGGHSAIFQLTAALAKRGHRNRFWFTPGNRFRSPAEVLGAIQRWYTPQNCEVRFLDPTRVGEVTGDVCIATEHSTAYYAAAVQNVRTRCYLVQDFEPYFFPHGVAYLNAEATYRLDLQPIVYGAWLASVLQPYRPEKVPTFDLGIDHGVYRGDESASRLASSTVAFYLRETTPRRCCEFGLLALELLAKKVPDLEVHFFGQRPLPFERHPYRFVNHGVLAPATLAALYHRVRVGVVFSATNHSLIPAEMMACGLPVVELDSPSVKMDFPSTTLTRVSLHPEQMAAGIARLLSDGVAWEAQQRAGFDFTRSLTWDRSAQQFSHILEEKLRAVASPA